jgi:hypothetical protein
MNLYLIWQDVNVGYDTYDSAVVYAETEDEARQVNVGNEYSWTPYPECVQVQLIGIADKSVLEMTDYRDNRIIVASFNAG